MLAGRKLLLADDSPTIQKVVELTFADEGVTVVSVGSGAEALEKLAEDQPDVVLADVCMPPPSGYEICKYVKQNAELRHIPVMLLVGSFEPFDEAEARSVGADDILTKPFQSIRRLIDRVGGLVSPKQDPDKVQTAELPQVEDKPEPQKMSTDEIEITTANTRPLPEGVAPEAITGLSAQTKTPETAISDQQPQSEPEPLTNDKEMETDSLRTEPAMDGNDVLLDLGELTPAHSSRPEDFVLDIDLDEPAPALYAEGSGAASTPAFMEPQVSTPTSVDWQLESEPSDLLPVRNTGELNTQPPTSAQRVDTDWSAQPPAPTWTAPVAAAEPRKLERVFDEPAASRSDSAIAPASAGALAPEQIEAIARRAVEMLSEKVVQQVVWEVVPQLAELMIKRKLEEQETQPK